MLSELRKGSFLASKTGALAWWEESGRPPIVLLVDPPYALVGSTTSSGSTGSTKRGASNPRTIRRALSYGALTSAVRHGLAALTTHAEWSMIYGLTCDMGRWRAAITKAGARWCGVGIVKQTRGAPRIHGDAPGVRHLGLAIARRRRHGARWRGRAWAEYSETRPSSVKDRPIQGTREVKVLAEMIADMVISSERTPVIVDPCAGTGTTLVAARSMGLNAIGWERDGETWNYAQRVISGRGLEIEGQVDLQIGLESCI